VKKLFSGILFGLGFSISCLGVYTLWILWVVPLTFSSEDWTTSSYSTSQADEESFEYIENFHELPLDEKIEKSTAILVTETSKGRDGKYVSRVVEVLKKEDGVDMYYKQGDLYDDHPSYEGNDEFVPGGYIVFMGGNPASMRYSVSYSGDRIRSLGGISLALLRDKCAS